MCLIQPSLVACLTYD
eukprot:UN18350